MEFGGEYHEIKNGTEMVGERRPGTHIRTTRSNKLYDVFIRLVASDHPVNTKGIVSWTFEEAEVDYDETGAMIGIHLSYYKTHQGEILPPLPPKPLATKENPDGS